MSIYVLGYGSLMNVESASRTLKREIKLSDLIQVNLLGYARVWTVKDKIYSEKLAKRVDAVFLNIEKSSNFGQGINCILIKITQAELEKIKIREKNYNCIDVSNSVKPKQDKSIDPSSKIFAFIGKDTSKIKKKDPNLFIMGMYIKMVLTACRNLGVNFLQEFKNTTQIARFKVIDGNYVFVELEQAKYV